MRRPARILVASVALILAAVSSGPSALAASWKWTPEAVVDQIRVSSAEISPDGRMVLYVASRSRGATDKPGAAWSNLWIVPVSGGPPRRMTSADAEDKSPQWAPDGASFGFLSARGGDKAKTRLFVMPLSGGEPTPVTDEKTEVASFAWAPCGGRIAYLAADAKSETEENEEKAGRDWTNVDQNLKPRRLRVVAIGADGRAGTPQVVTASADDSIWEFDWSPSCKEIVATVSPTPRTDDSYMGKRVMILPVSGGAARQLVPNVGKVDQVAWSKDGATIAYRAAVDPHDSFSGSIFVVPAAGGAPANLTGDAAESVNRIEWMGPGRLAFASVRGTRTVLGVVDLGKPGSQRIVVSPGAESFTTFTLSADGRHLATAASTAQSPAEIHVSDLPAIGPARLRALTSSNPGIRALPLGRQELFAWKARDGMALEGVLVRPVGYAAGARYPLIVVPHGGPEGQYLDGWNTGYAAPAQAFAERGFFVLFPNYRGSTGRGTAFAAADHGQLGGSEFTDVLDGIDALASAYPIDRARVGITGGSYGGYFTALAVTRHSERFAAGVELFGITNWMSFLGTSDTPVENSKVHWALWCWEHAELCWDASPIRHIGNARTPTLIMHGAADERVPKTQSDELYTALRWKQVPVEYIVFPREKHGFREREHQVEAVARMLGWFDRYLLTPAR